MCGRSLHAPTCRHRVDLAVPQAPVCSHEVGPRGAAQCAGRSSCSGWGQRRLGQQVVDVQAEGVR